MALSDVEIWMEIQAGALTIDPPPEYTSVNAASVDLSLDRHVQVYKDVPEGMRIDMGDANATATVAYNTEVTDIFAKHFYIRQGEFVIAYTRETIGLPTHLLARVEGRSSLARLGISVHNQAPTIQPGWKGQIALELTNVGPLVLQLTEGLIICQLVLEHLGRPTTKPYQAQFQDQVAPGQ